MRISVHSNPEVFDGYRVVRFEVEPFSVKHVKDPKTGVVKTCTDKDKITHDLSPQPIGSSDPDTDKAKVDEVLWSYDIEWLPSEVPWASRWDVFFNRYASPWVTWQLTRSPAAPRKTRSIGSPSSTR
jgi:transmembrane 9 superfamily protein 2/4